MDEHDTVRMIAEGGCPVGQGWSDLQLLLRPLVKQCLDMALNSYSRSEPRENVVSDNQYLMDQFDSLSEAPFTLQRLCEILLNPSQYHNTPNWEAGSSSSSECKESIVLRGEKLQAAVRRCVLVSPLE